MTTIFENKHWIVEKDGSRPLLVVRRTPWPYTVAAEVELSFRPMETALDAADRRSLVLLLDMRAAPFRNDAEFEAAAHTHPQRFFRGFLRMAVVVRTAAGRLQAQRYFRQRGVEVATFIDEIEAIASLLAPPSSRRP
ncbi:MAG: hypothetical protein U0359_27345 [Byssovorax sp.]